MIKDLQEIGFCYVGEWKLNGGVLKHNCQELPDAKNALYCFVIESEVFYVGKTTNTLKKRLWQYENSHDSQRTNKKVSNKLIEQLSNGKEVSVFIFVDPKPKTKGRFYVNLSAGLEDSIINTLNPIWNQMSKRRIKNHSDGS